MTEPLDLTTPINLVTIRVPGQQGPAGIAGPAAALGIGTVTTGAAGSAAAATVTGTPPGQVLNLTIPRGADGAQGPANVLSIGTVTTGPAGSNAAATITGTPPSQILNLTLPTGAQGPAGSGASDATTLAKGSIRLSGDLGGTADSPTVLAGVSTATISTLVRRNSSGDSAFNQVDLTAAPTQIYHATRKDYVDSIGTSVDTANTIVRRDANGLSDFKRVYLKLPQGTQGDEAARKDYVDAIGSEASVASTIVRRDTNSDITARRFLMTAATSVNNGAARKDYVDAGDAERTRQYSFNPGTSAGSPRYTRLLTMDGNTATSGADASFILSGTGDYGGANRGTVIVHMAQRGSNTVQVKAWGFDVENTLDSVSLFTKQISEFVFELWGRFADYNYNHTLHVLNSGNEARVTINVDSQTPTAPTGLSAEYPILSMSGTDVMTADTLVRRSSGGTFRINSIVALAAPSQVDHLTRKDYVDNIGTDAATGDTVVRRRSNGWTNLSGITGLGAPANANDAANKDYVDTQVATKANTTHTHTAANISDSTTVGRSILTAADAAAVRAASGAGTSNLSIGTTNTTAKAGDYQPTAVNISDSTTVGRSVLTAASASAARTAIGAGTSDLVIGTTSTTAKAGDYTPPSDSAAATPSMRTLGTGATQAAAGNHTHASASETVVGMVELATTAEASTATDTVRAVTPAGLAAYTPKVLVLASGAAVPGGTPANTVIFRTA